MLLCLSAPRSFADQYELSLSHLAPTVSFFPPLSKHSLEFDIIECNLSIEQIRKTKFSACSESHKSMAETVGEMVEKQTVAQWESVCLALSRP